MSKSNKFNLGDLVKLTDCLDNDRTIGIIIDISPKAAHVRKHGLTYIVRVYWPLLNDSDWEYDFFLEKITDENLTDGKQ